MKTIDSLKKQVQDNFKKSETKKKFLIEFDRKAFKKNLSQQDGFGSSDLKPIHFELYMWLLKTYKARLHLEMSASRSGFGVKFYYN